jgi:GNAT superfamily N-acetyltransferase
LNQVEVRPVTTRREKRIFLTFPWRIYHRDPLWVPPLLTERAVTIDPQQGAFFKRGMAQFFIAWKNGLPVGTICAGEDQVGNRLAGNREALWGFFECIDDYSVAEALWMQAIQWAQEQRLESLYGPFNLDYEDAYGILVEGRDRPPVLLCGHTPPYYLDFVQRFGFEPGREQNLAFAIDVREDTPALQQLSRLAERVRKRERFVIRHANFDDWESEIDRVLPLLNAALAHLPDYIPWQRDTLSALLQPFKEIANPELILFAEDEGKVIGFFPGVPNMNEVLIHIDGLRYPWDYLKALWYKRLQPECLAIKSVLVHPDYWGNGTAILLFDEMLRRIRKFGYKWVDLSLTGQDNPKTPMLAERLGASVYKRYQVYRYKF